MPHAPRPANPIKMKPRVHFEFEQKAVPAAVKEVSIDDEVMVVLRGKVKSISQYEESSSLSIEYTRLELVSGAKPKTMTEVLNELHGET